LNHAREAEVDAELLRRSAASVPAGATESPQARCLTVRRPPGRV